MPVTSEDAPQTNITKLHGVTRELYLPQIDALRAIAAMAVVFFHLYTDVYLHAELRPLKMLADLRNHSGFWRWGAALSLLGYTGVPLFFVISGFCIHHSFLHARQPFSYMRFMGRRLWRIYPAYVLAIALSLLLPGNLIWRSHHVFKSVIMHLLFVHNLNQTTIYELSPPFWTLAVEFQFYGAFPLLLLLRRWAGIYRATLISLCLGAGLSLFWHLGYLGHLRLPFMPVMYWVQWCLGALIAERFANYKPALLNLPLAGVLCFIGILFAVPFDGYSEWNYLAWAILCAVIIERWIRRDRGPAVAPVSWLFSWLVWMGTISYSTYLLHAIILSQVLPRLHGSAENRFPFAVIITLPLVIAASAATYYLIELPGIAMGRRCLGWFFPSQRNV